MIGVVTRAEQGFTTFRPAQCTRQRSTAFVSRCNEFCLDISLPPTLQGTLAPGSVLPAKQR